MMWNDTFNDVFRDAVARYHEGHRNPDTFFTEKEFLFLNSIGYKPVDLYDYIEDYANGGLPSPTTTLLIAAVRRDYFLTIQHGEHGLERMVMASDLPTAGEKLEGIAYLPRIIAKAEAALKGALAPDVMYSCTLDREFLHEHGDIHPADFLRVVWAAHGDYGKVAQFVLSMMKAG